MIKPAAGWLLLLLVPVALLAAKPLRIGVEINTAPVSFLDDQGRPTGFSAELIQAMAATGLEVELVPSSWTQLLEGFERGDIDVLANVVARPNRTPAMAYSVGHAQVHGVAYRRADHAPMERTADFAGKKIGTVAGTVAYYNAVAHQGWGAELVTYDSWQAALDATHNREVDATLLLSSLSTRLVNLHKLKSDFVDDVVHQYRFAVREGETETLARINDALATVRHNGSFDRIYAKWIGPIEPHPIRLADLRPYAVPAVAVVLAVTGLLWWQRRMLARVARHAEALRRSEERWKFALEGSGDGVWDWNAQTNQVLRSKRWKEMLGYTEDEIGAGLHEWTSRIHPDDLPGVLAAQEAHHAGRTPSLAVEHRLRCKDGSWKWVLNRGMVVQRDEAGRPLRVIGTHTDLTGRKQAEEDRLILGKLESTGVLAGGIAHDFNNLLTAILLNLELAQLGGAVTGKAGERIQAAHKAALSAQGLTQQLITFAHGDTSVARVTDLTTLLQESIPLVLTGSTVRGETAIAPGLWPAEVDAGQIGQVVRNLVLNAREAMPAGGVVTLRAANVVLHGNEGTSLSAGDYVDISVTDQGEGIAAEVIPKIFDPYFSTKQRGPQRGMGLGLTICHSIVQKHRGTITVESAPGRGTTFHVYLPAALHAAPRDLQTPAAAVVGVRPARILIMDDEPAIRESVVQTLQQLGHTVEAVADGQTAVARYAAARAAGEAFDVVFLDLTVPGGMGGQEAITVLRQADPAVRAVVMSGYTNNEVLHDSARYGFAAALKKPFDLSALREVLGKVLTA